MNGKKSPKKVYIIYRQECAQCTKDCNIRGYLLGTLDAFREVFGISSKIPIVEIDSMDVQGIQRLGIIPIIEIVGIDHKPIDFPPLLYAVIEYTNGSRILVHQFIPTRATVTAITQWKGEAGDLSDTGCPNYSDKKPPKYFT